MASNESLIEFYRNRKKKAETPEEKELANKKLLEFLSKYETEENKKWKNKN